MYDYFGLISNPICVDPSNANISIHLRGYSICTSTCTCLADECFNAISCDSTFFFDPNVGSMRLTTDMYML
jgi:hypothetical protein